MTFPFLCVLVLARSDLLTAANSSAVVRSPGTRACGMKRRALATATAGRPRSDRVGAGQLGAIGLGPCRRRDGRGDLGDAGASDPARPRRIRVETLRPELLAL